MGESFTRHNSATSRKIISSMGNDKYAPFRKAGRLRRKRYDFEGNDIDDLLREEIGEREKDRIKLEWAKQRDLRNGRDEEAKRPRGDSSYDPEQQ